MPTHPAPTAFDVDASTSSMEAALHPWPVYDELRRRGPVVQVSRPGGMVAYAITGYQHAVRALQDPRFTKDTAAMRSVFQTAGVSAQQSGFVLSGAASRHLLNTDPPDHTRLRRLVARAFTPRRVDALRPRIQQLTDELLTRLRTAETPDLISGLAFPLSIDVICELLGIPAADRADFRTWSTAASTPAVPGTATTEDGSATLHEYLQALIVRRRAELAGLDDPGEAADVLSGMIVARDTGDELSDAELVGMSFLLLIAGHETTVGLIGSAALGLSRHRDQRALLLADPDLIAPAIEEFLRFDGPVQRSTFRAATEDVEIAGTLIPRGAIVSIMIGSANHDGNHFAHADDLDIRRERVPHLAFGQGVHFCLGAPLARLEARIAIGSLLRDYPDYSLACAESALRYQTTVIRALEALPVRLG